MIFDWLFKKKVNEDMFKIGIKDLTYQEMAEFQKDMYNKYGDRFICNEPV